MKLFSKGFAFWIRFILYNIISAVLQHQIESYDKY